MSAQAIPTTQPRRHTGRFSPPQIVFYAILAIIALIYIYPFLIEIFTVFKTDTEASSNSMSLIPKTWSVAALNKLLLNSAYPRWFANSVIVTAFVTAGRVFFNSLAGYALARLRFKGRNIVFAGLVGVMSVPMVVLLIPRSVLLNWLGLYSTYAGMIIPLLVDATGVFIMKNFFESIPVSVEESARVDGASSFRIFWSIVLPMAVPALITIAILSFQGSWNELSHFIVATGNPDQLTLTTGVATLIAGGVGAANQYPFKLAAAAIMTIPVVVIFFIFQKRIMNVGGGAVKE